MYIHPYLITFFILDSIFFCVVISKFAICIRRLFSDITESIISYSAFAFFLASITRWTDDFDIAFFVSSLAQWFNELYLYCTVFLCNWKHSSSWTVSLHIIFSFSFENVVYPEESTFFSSIQYNETWKRFSHFRESHNCRIQYMKTTNLLLCYNENIYYTKDLRLK